MVKGRDNFPISNILPAIVNDCNLFVEKHIFNDGTHIRHSSVGTDEESVSDVVARIELKSQRERKESNNENT